MPDANYTPGPWIVRGALGFATYIVAADGTPIACGYAHGTVDGDANGRLIAAAPEMSEALQAHEALVKQIPVLAYLLGQYQSLLEAAIEGELVPGTGQPNPDDVDACRQVQRDRRRWRKAEEMQKLLEAVRRRGDGETR